MGIRDAPAVAQAAAEVIAGSEGRDVDVGSTRVLVFVDDIIVVGEGEQVVEERKQRAKKRAEAVEASLQQTAHVVE